MHRLGQTAALYRYTAIYRQNFVGWSFVNEPSYYSLAGISVVELCVDSCMFKRRMQTGVMFVCW